MKAESINVSWTESRFEFAGTNEDGICYEVKFDLFKPINSDESKFENTGREIQVVLVKKEAEWWDKLYNGPKLKTVSRDWNKWKDEDDDEYQEAESMDGMG